MGSADVRAPDVGDAVTVIDPKLSPGISRNIRIVTELDLAAGVVTVMSRLPEVRPTPKFTTAVVELVIKKLLLDVPGPASTVIGAMKLTPDKVTLSMAPRYVNVGAIDLRIGRLIDRL